MRLLAFRKRLIKIIQERKTAMMDSTKTVHVTYMYPFKFIVNGDETLNFTIEEINSLSYDHSLLHRIIGIVTNCYKGRPIDYIVCGDGALGIKKDYGLSNDDLLLHYNDLLCKLLLGGIEVESISFRDMTSGKIYESKSIWPVGFGESLNSHIHAELRMRVVGVTDAIILYQPEDRTINIDKMKSAIEKGSKIVSSIPNLSTYHLLNGITELKHSSWSSALTFLWIIVEEITDYLWEKEVIEKVTGDNAKKRKEILKDTRSYTMAVKQEFLLQIGIIDIELYDILFKTRQVRNKLIHEGKMISKNDAMLLYDAIKRLLSLLSQEDILT